MVLERPKVIFNPRTKKYVMWMHIDDGPYKKASAGVAISNSPTGPFEYLRSVRPLGAESRDMTLFADDDGAAYLLFSSENNRTLHIARLSDDYLDFTSEVTRNFIEQKREAPVIFKSGDLYYLITSGLSGWFPNEAQYAVANSVMGPWKMIGNPCIGEGAETTFQGQGTYVVQAPGGQWIFMADRWNPESLKDSRYLWLPMAVDGEKVGIEWKSEWSYQEPNLSNAFLQIDYRDGALVVSPKHPQSGPGQIRYQLPEGMLPTPKVEDCHDLKLGPGRRMLLAAPERTISVTLYEENPFLFVETQVANSGEQVISHDVLPIARITFEAGSSGNSTQWKALGSGGLSAVEQAQASFAYLAVADPASRSGAVCAWLTQERGLGTFLPKFENGALHVTAELEFGNLRIAPGKARDTDTLILGFFPDVRIGLETYTDEVVRNRDFKLLPKTGVYCSWYHRRDDSLDGASDHEIVARNSAFAQENLQPFGLTVYQLDDHWQALGEGRPVTAQDIAQFQADSQGPIKTFTHSNTKFPEGMKDMAENIRAKGFAPGIWFMPFSANSRAAGIDFPAEIFAKDAAGQPLKNTRWSGTTIDATSPAGEAFLRERFRTIRHWGYDYIKVDGLHSGTPSDNLYVHRIPKGKSLRTAVLHDPDQTFIEAFRRGVAILREEMPGVFILGCASTQNMVSFAPAFGLIDACRIGPDNDLAARGNWTNLTYGAEYSGNHWFLNNRIWHNDPDPVFVRSSNPIEKVRWMVSWLAVSGVMNTTSEIYADLPPDRLDIIKRTLPSHNLPARPVDILDRKTPAVWIVGNGRQHIVGLFNWAENSPATLAESFERLGLDAKKSYDAFDYWGNQYLGRLSREIKVSLPAGGCQVLSLRESSDHPQVVSVRGHLKCTTRGHFKMHHFSTV